MTRGTTPTLSFTISDIDYLNIDIAELTIRQFDKNIIVKRLDNTDNVLEASLTEQETLSLSSGSCKMQIKIKMNDDSIIATDIISVDVNEILNESWG